MILVWFGTLNAQLGSKYETSERKQGEMMQVMENSTYSNKTYVKVGLVNTVHSLGTNIAVAVAPVLTR